MKTFILLLPSLLFTIAAGHGFMSKPNPRGSLSKGKFQPHSVDEDAPKDHWAHFPAGDRHPKPGSGLRSQIRQAGPRGWTPFLPLDPSFRWRAGVCGDEKIKGKKQPHLRGGEYYYNAKIVATYRQGGIVDFELSIIAHHNGFMEAHVCDVKKCDGEISETCFREGHCQPLIRARNRECDSGTSKKCGPIDRNYPGRWYFPCTTTKNEQGWEIYGGGTIKYRLPADLTCEHCVLQWFWTAANTCNPPGVIEYFDGPDAPRNWGKCKGQGGAMGGVTRVQKPCAKDRFPEEYLDCADIRIVPTSSGAIPTSSGVKDKSLTGPDSQSSPGRTPTSSPKPSYSNSPRPSPKPSRSSSPPPSPKPSQSNTPRPSPKPSQSKSPRPSPTPSQSKTPRPSPKPSQSNSPRPSPKPSQSKTPRPSPKPSQSKTPRPSPKPSQSKTPRPSPKPSRSNTPRPSPKPSRSSTPRPLPKPSRSSSPEPSPSSSPRPSPKPSRSSTPRPSPTPSRSRTPRPSPKRRVSPRGISVSRPSPSESPVPSPSASPSASAVSAMDFDGLDDVSASLEPEPSFFPEESPEESMSPEPDFSVEPSSEDYGFDLFEPNPRNGLIRDIILVADGKDVGSVVNGDIVNISGYDKIALKAVTTRKVAKVEFYVNGEKVWTEFYMEYFLFGNSKSSPFYWSKPPLDVWLEVITVAEDEEDVLNIMFTK